MKYIIPAVMAVFMLVLVPGTAQADTTQQAGPVSVTLSDPCIFTNASGDQFLQSDVTLTNNDTESVDVLIGSNIAVYGLQPGQTFTIEDVNSNLIRPNSRTKSVNFRFTVYGNAMLLDTYKGQTIFEFSTTKQDLRGYPACA